MGAQQYGTLYPYIRFSFRDHFLSKRHVHDIIHRYIPHAILKKTNNKDQSITQTIPSSTIDPNNNHIPNDNDLQDNDDVENDNDDIASDDDIDIYDDDDDLSIGKATSGISKCNSTLLPSDKCPNTWLAIQRIIQKHSTYTKKGYKEVALSVRPSMTMMASILYLAIIKNSLPINSMDDNNDVDTDMNINITAKKARSLLDGLTYIDLCEWIKTGIVPLMTAYHHLLSNDIQQQVQGIGGFYRIDRSKSDTYTINQVIFHLSITDITTTDDKSNVG